MCPCPAVVTAILTDLLHCRCRWTPKNSKLLYTGHFVQKLKYVIDKASSYMKAWNYMDRAWSVVVAPWVELAPCIPWDVQYCIQSHNQGVCPLLVRLVLYGNNVKGKETKTFEDSFIVEAHLDFDLMKLHLSFHLISLILFQHGDKRTCLSQMAVFSLNLCTCNIHVITELIQIK